LLTTIAVATSLAVALPAHADEQNGFGPDPDPEDVYWEVPLVHSLVLMTTMRTAEAFIWPDPFAESPLQWGRHYGEALMQPPVFDASQDPFEWDGDPWYLNVFGHGLFGSELYLRARTCHHNVLESLLFTAATSAMWEYAFEGNGVRPSGLDLWYTPLSGLLLGEGRHAVWRAADSIEHRGLRGAVRAVFDPFGELERALFTPC